MVQLWFESASNYKKSMSVGPIRIVFQLSRFESFIMPITSQIM